LQYTLLKNEQLLFCRVCDANTTTAYPHNQILIFQVEISKKFKMKVIKSLFLGAALVAGRTIQAHPQSSMLEMHDAMSQPDWDLCVTAGKTGVEAAKKAISEAKDADTKKVEEAKKTEMCKPENAWGKCAGTAPEGVKDDEKKEVAKVTAFCGGGGSCCR